MTKGSHFQIANMPSLTSDEYTAEFNKLKELGTKDSKILSLLSIAEANHTPNQQRRKVK